MTARKKACDGFTLFELLTVMALIAVLAAFVVPTVHLSKADSLADAVAKINTAIDEARTRSIMRRQRHTLQFSADGIALLPDGGRVRFDANIKLIFMEIEGQEERMSDDLPALLPFHWRGNTVNAQLTLEHQETGERRELALTPLGFAARDINE